MSYKVRKHKMPKSVNGINYLKNKRLAVNIILKIFPNYFIKKKYEIVKKILPEFVNDKIISNTFKFRDADKIKEIPKHYLSIQNKDFFELSYFYETRKCYVSSNQEKIKTTSFICKNDFLDLGIGIFEDLIQNVIKSNKEIELEISVKILCKNNAPFSKTFSIPLSKSRHGYFGPVVKKNFFDLRLNLEKFKGKNIDVIMQGRINKGANLAYKATNEDIKRFTKNTKPFIAWSPQLFNVSIKSEVKKIILLSFESMTSSWWLKDNFSLDIELPSLANLKSDSIHFPHALAQVDSTRPFIASMLHGLFASQHSFGDYSKKSSYKKFIPKSIKSIPQLLNEKSFYSSAYVPYSHFDSYFGFSKGFDSYNCAPRPEMNTVPDISWVIRSLNSKLNTNQFIYNHLQFLHPPFLLNTVAQAPKTFDIDSLSAAHQKDFLPLYLNQLDFVDKQLTQLVGYLKENNLYDQTLLIVLGDHGVGMPPWWKKSNNEYAHYEMRSRIPLYIKKPKWSKSERNWNTKKPANASLIPFIEIIESTGCQFPDYWNDINGVESLINEKAIIETIFHPNYDNYSISIINGDHKYWLNSEVDWQKNELISILNQKLFKYNREKDIFDETNDLLSGSSSDANDKIVKENQDFIKSFFKKNRNFHSNHMELNL